MILTVVVPDDRDRPRRPRTHAGDDDRATIGARHRRIPGDGTPVEIDPELTPPPSLPPPPDADETTDRLERLEVGLERLADGLGKVWNARHAGENQERGDHERNRQSERIDKLVETTLSMHTLLNEFVMPALKASQMRVDILLTNHETSKARVTLFWDEQWPNAVDSLKGLGERLGRIERVQEDQGRELRTVAAQVSSSSAVGNALDTRVTALEQRIKADAAERDKSLAVVAATKARDRWWIGGMTTIGVAIFEGAKALFDHFRH